MRLKYLCTSYSTALTQSEISDSGPFAVYGATGVVGYVSDYSSAKEYLSVIKDGASVGRVAYCNPKTSLLGTMAYIIPNERADINWLKYVLISLDLGKSVSKTTIPHIYFSDYGNREIPYVDHTAQRKIAQFLDYKCVALDEVLTRTRASIDEYKKLKQAVITEAVTKGVRGKRPMKDSGVEWIGSIPEDWQVFRVANLYREASDKGNDELPILTVSINSGVSDRELSDEESERVFVRSEDRSKYKRVQPGDLVYNMMRAWQGAFGAVRVDGMVSPAYVVARPMQQLDSRYVEYLFRTPEAIEEMHRYSYGVADFRLRLYWPQFRNIRMCVPPYEEQVEIADYIDKKVQEILALIKKKEQYLVELENYKKSLIYEYVTGKKEVPVNV